MESKFPRPTQRSTVGNFLCNIGAVGQGPGEYQAIYDIRIDEAAGRIYLLPWTRSELLVYDLEGNVQPSVPLCLRVNKGKLRFRTDSLLTVFLFALPRHARRPLDARPHGDGEPATSKAAR